MPPPDSNFILGEVRQLNSTIRAGGTEALPSFHKLTNRILNITIAAPGSTLKLIKIEADPTKAALGGRSAREPLRLNNGRYLRISARLYLDKATHPNFLKVEETSYQYQLDQDGDSWIFRYDYLRNPPHAYPASHLQINGQLAEAHAIGDLPLKKIHFPTGRVSIEAVIRLLIEQFEVPSNTLPAVWRPVLAESERDFLRVAHQALSGPEF